MTYCMYDFDLGKFSSNILILKDLYMLILEFKVMPARHMQQLCVLVSKGIVLLDWKAVIPRLCTKSTEFAQHTYGAIWDILNF